MPCVLTVSMKGHILFPGKVLSLTKIDELKSAFLTLDETYPQEKGFELGIKRVPDFSEIPRNDFRQACQSEDWRVLIDCFFSEEEFKAFCQQVTVMNVDEAYYHIDDLKDYPDLTLIRCYPDGGTIFELSKERKLFQIYGHSDFTHDDLLTVERELYRVFIKTFDKLPYPTADE